MKWASDIVIVPKQNVSGRIRGDYRTKVSAKTKNNNYHLPTMEELFSKLAGGKCFTVFDLKDSYFCNNL